jgi:hypothetical protein
MCWGPYMEVYDGKLTTQLYNKRDDFNFAIVNFPYTCSNIPLSPSYGSVYIFQLIRYARTCSTYDQFFSRVRQLTDKLMLQGFLQSRLTSFYGCYNDLIHNYKLSLSHMLFDIFHTNNYTLFGTVTLTADHTAFMTMELGSQRVWPVDRGCLFS